MNILHIASFVGNIGDNASHLGLERILEQLFTNYQTERQEIRKFYKNYSGNDKQYFDENFLDNLKNADLCIIGGGGFLDYWVEGSSSGTTIDMSPELVSKISTPTLICSVGCIPHRPVPEGNIARLHAFLTACQNNPCVQIILRNDGSPSNIHRLFGNVFNDLFSEGLDNAFFVEKEHTFPFLPTNGRYVAMNLSDDQLTMQSELRGAIDEAHYYQQLAKATLSIFDNDLSLVLIPHIYTDLKAISKLLPHLDDYIIREKVTIAPCIQFDRGARYISSIYENAALSIGMRFHANVIPVALGTPSIGLIALDRVKHMYDSLGLSESYVFADIDFAEPLGRKIVSHLNHEPSESAALPLARQKASTLHCYFEALRYIGVKDYLNV